MAKKRDEELITVELADLHELPGANPTGMSEEQEGELEASMRAHGFRQALTVVRRAEGGYWLSDGVHRKDVAARLGITRAPALLKEGDVTAVRAERLALNRIRGQVDLTAAARELAALVDAGWKEEDLAACGFSPEEVDVLLAQGAGDAVDEATEATLSEGPTVVHAKRYGLSLTFDSKDHRDAVRGALLRHGASMEEGLRAVLGLGVQQ